MPIPSLPAEIRELMTVPVVWEKSGGVNGMGEPSFSNPVTLNAWVEPHTSSGGVDAVRRADGVVVEPQYVLYFSGDDPRVRNMAVSDRFTVPGVDAQGRPLEALSVGTLAGPNFDNTNPWLVSVTL